MKKSQERLVVEALERIFGRNIKAIISDGVIVQWGEIDPEPSAEEIKQTVQTILDEYPMQLLREERDKRIAMSDWRLTNDYPHGDQEDWKIYRQMLRDLPNQIENGEVPSPTLDERGELIFEHWPVPPNVT